MRVWDTAVIGAGPAGCGAAVQCRRLGLDVLLIEKDKNVGGLLREARLVENYPGLEGPASGWEIAARLAGFLKRFDIEPITDRVSWIHETDGLYVICTGGIIHKSRGVILATGTVPVPFELPGGAPVRRSLGDALRDSPSRAAVIGGGEAALDYALSLSDRGCAVDLMVRGGSLGAEGTLAESVNGDSNIRVHFGTVVTSAEGSKERIYLRVENGSGGWETTVDTVLAAVGREPAVPNLEHELDISGSTTQPQGLLVAGDLAEGSLGQASTASGQGVRAAGLMARYLRKKG